jgi:hypothetical protein
VSVVWSVWVPVAPVVSAALANEYTASVSTAVSVVELRAAVTRPVTGSAAHAVQIASPDVPGGTLPGKNVVYTRCVQLSPAPASVSGASSVPPVPHTNTPTSKRFGPGVVKLGVAIIVPGVASSSTTIGNPGSSVSGARAASAIASTVASLVVSLVASTVAASLARSRSNATRPQPAATTHASARPRGMNTAAA